MQLLVAILLLIVLGFFVWRLKIFRKQKIKRNIFVLLLVLKIISGFGVYYIYTYYYDPKMSDIHKFYKGGQSIYAATDDNFTDYLRLITGIQGDKPQLQKYYDNSDHWTRRFDYGLFNDNRTIIRFNAIVCLFSFGNMYIHIVIMGFLSFLGSFYLFRGLKILLNTKDIILIIVSFIVPSHLFWTSGLLKEGLMVFALGFAFYYLTKLYNKFNIFYFIGFLVACLLLFASKIYVLPAFLPAVFFLFLIKNMNVKYQIISFTGVILISSLFVIFSSNIIGYDIIKTVSQKQNDFVNYINSQDDTGSAYNLTKLPSDTWGFIKSIPVGFFYAFFRPFPNEVNSVFMLLAFLEVVLFVILLVIPIFYFKKPSTDNFRIILFFIMFILFLFSLVGVYTPNTGSIVRYRVPALPFLYLIPIIITDWEKILTNKKLKKIFKNVL